MTKIRKGNDVRLKIQLKFTKTNDAANIQSLRAVFVNTTLRDAIHNEYINKNRFVGRFPIEPFVNGFTPTAYNINSTGYSQYRALVYNQYNGFGINPDWKKSCPVRDVNITEYQAEVSYTEEPGVVTVTFPAEAQLYNGVYNLVIIANVFEEGYNNNTRTVATNYNKIFQLVEDSADATDKIVQFEIYDSNYEINPDSEENQPGEGLLDDIYIVSGVYGGKIDGKETIKLYRNDDSVINIDIDPISGWYVEGDEL